MNLPSDSQASQSAEITEAYCWLLLGLFVLLSVLGNVVWQNVRAGDFDSEEAIQIIETVFGDELPHPAGSQQNDVIRQRIVDLVTDWGYKVEIHRSQNHIRRDKKREKVPLENILFRLPGKNHHKPILLCAHYDSKPGTPGISDDGVGVGALLTIAKNLKNGPPLNRDILFLLTDGEEYGLLGAERWCEEHPLADEVVIAINLEARGSSGPSLMFETGPESSWLIRAFKESSDHPRTSSLFYEVYRFLPNDTDFSIFKKHGITGYNFAFIGDVEDYHAVTDNLSNLSPSSLDHHGENMLGLTSTLQQFDLDPIPQGRAVYFDLFGFMVVHWPESWSLWICGALTLFYGVFAYRIFSNRMTNDRKAYRVRDFLGFAGRLAGSGLLVLGACYLMKLDPRLESRWLNNPLPAQWALWLIAGLAWPVSSVLASALNRSSESQGAPTRAMNTHAGDFQNWFFHCVLLWLSLGWLTCILVPGMSYLFLFPLFGGLAGIPFFRNPCLRHLA